MYAVYHLLQCEKLCFFTSLLIMLSYKFAIVLPITVRPAAVRIMGWCLVDNKKK